MRLLLVAAMLLVPVTASAERATDFSYVRGGETNEGSDELPGARLPAQPSLFVHLGSDGPQGMARFTLADGTPIPPAMVTELQSGDYDSLYRVDFALDKGEIEVWFGDATEPVATFVIDPNFVPRTRSVSVRPSGGSLYVDSDAVVYRIIGPYDQMRLELSDGPHVFVTEGQWQRVSALYANGTEEMIYDGEPAAHVDSFEPPLPDLQRVPRSRFHIERVLLAWLFLALFVIVRRRRIQTFDA